MITPGASEELWNELHERHTQAVSKESRGKGVSRSEKEVKLLEAFAKSYLNVQHWSIRRQTLSLMAEKLFLNELHGRAAPVSYHENRRIRIDPEKLEHLCFIYHKSSSNPGCPVWREAPKIVNS